MQLIATDTPSVVIGMGLTGMSCARYLCQAQQNFILMDTRTQPPADSLKEAEKLQRQNPKMSLQLGELDADTLIHAKQIILSPGIAKSHPAIEQAKAAGVPILGDVQLFLQHLAKRKMKQPSSTKIIGVTGSNGKSTVVTALGIACEAAGLNTVVAGNIGVPVLDVLDDNAPLADIYILELSSFQLELVQRAALDVACVLNVSADHMDRYPSLAHYCQAKLRIYFGAKNIVYNVTDMLTIPPLMENVNRYGFSQAKPVEENQKPVFIDSNNQVTIDKTAMIDANQFALKGQHNIENILAVLAILHAADVDISRALPALVAFKGLPHRCQTVSVHNGVTYINDSKATNVGAAVAAIHGLSEQCKRLILIAGGEGKGADFTLLANAVASHVSHIFVLGNDAGTIASAINKKQHQVHIEHCNNLEQAVIQAAQIARVDDIVLLSPACASLDMFANFEQRGDVFVSAVEGLADA